MGELNPYEQFIAEKVRDIAATIEPKDLTADNVTVVFIHRVFPEIYQQGEVPDFVHMAKEKWDGPRTAFYERYYELLPFVEWVLHARA